MIPARHAGLPILLCLLGYLAYPLSAYSQTVGTEQQNATPANWASSYAQAGNTSDGAANAAAAQQVSPLPLTARQSQEDAWWTGPMLANSAETLPPGHFLLEPYLYDITTAHSNSYGSRTYLLYGLADRLSVGVIPVFGYNTVSGGPSSSGIGLGDFTVQAQYRLTEFHEGSWMPTTAVMVQETFPTGKYDQLGDRLSNGIGSGAYTTTLALNSQMYFWLPNGRILRMRFDVSEAFSHDVNIDGASVYGTTSGFHGNAKPGNALFADLSWEYSVTQRWVVAFDATYSDDRNTLVTGYNALDPNIPIPGGAQPTHNIRQNSGSSQAFGFAPAIEYNWTPNLGVLFGTRVVLAGHNTTRTVTPAIALNYVH